MSQTENLEAVTDLGLSAVLQIKGFRLVTQERVGRYVHFFFEKNSGDQEIGSYKLKIDFI